MDNDDDRAATGVDEADQGGGHQVDDDEETSRDKDAARSTEQTKTSAEAIVVQNWYTSSSLCSVQLAAGRRGEARETWAGASDEPPKECRKSSRKRTGSAVVTGC